MHFERMKLHFLIDYWAGNRIYGKNLNQANENKQWKSMECLFVHFFCRKGKTLIELREKTQSKDKNQNQLNFSELNFIIHCTIYLPRVWGCYWLYLSTRTVKVPGLKWFCGSTIPDCCSCCCRDRWSIADCRLDGTIPMCVKGVVALPCRLAAAPNKVRLGGCGWGWCSACEVMGELSDIAMDWGDNPGTNPEWVAWQLLRSTGL